MNDVGRRSVSAIKLLQAGLYRTVDRDPPRCAGVIIRPLAF